MSSLADPEKRTLLHVARRAVTLAVERRELLEDLPPDHVLQQPGGAFVTLHHGGRLRGCVGQLASKDPLVAVVAYCAMAAALEDPRFAPVAAHELPGIEIELSVLSQLVEIPAGQVESLIQIGTHGLMITRGPMRGVLLPQVAVDFGWTAGKFLKETCTKAGLEGDAWKQPDARVQLFTADVFSETALPESSRAPSTQAFKSNR